MEHAIKWVFRLSMTRATFLIALTAALSLGGAGGWALRGIRESRLRDGPEVLAPPTSGGAAFARGRSGSGKTPIPAALPQSITEDLLLALQDRVLTAEFRGNARDRLRMTGINRATQPLRLSIPAGQTFESANGNVVVIRACLVDFRPGESRIEDFATAGTASTNRVADALFVPSVARHARLEPLLEALADLPEVATPTAQTAALALLENLPAGAFAQFAETGNDLPNQWDTAAFKVETVDIIQALILLRQMGIPDEQLAITVDPQTKIEAMIDPLAHAVAMRHYGIPAEGEWAYWKHELLEGDPSTRHYALHGIARYFPEVALPMLPRWAREARTSAIFRTVAIQALAETRRSEAVPVLKALEQELGAQTELGKTAAEAGRILERQLNSPTTGARKAIVFRINRAPGRL